MGLPDVVVAFKEQAVLSIKRGDRGIIALILKDETVKSGIYEMFNETEIKKELSEENKTQIMLAFKGYVKKPKKVIVCIQKPQNDQEEADYTESLKLIGTKRFDYLVIPTVQTDGKTEEIRSWIKLKRDEGKRYKAILPNTAADSEGIINFTTKRVKVNETEYTTEQYCSRIAGIIAGTPMTMSCTYAELGELTECEEIEGNKEQIKAIDNGELILINDDEEIKIARGVNSFTTTGEGKENQYKKIKIIEAMDMIYGDITRTCKKSYIGKHENSYNNKCILISAILGYLNELKGIVDTSKSTVEIDIEANKEYLKEKGTDVTELDDEEIKQGNTGDKVFLKGSLSILDAMEDIYLPFAI